MASLNKYVSGNHKNRILDSLDVEGLSEVLQQAEFIKIDRNRVIVPAFQPVDHIYFVTSGMVSLNVTMDSGSIAEIGLIGSEGVVGWQAVAQMDTGPIEAAVQIDMTGYRIKASQMIALIEKVKPLRLAIYKAAQAMFDQVSQAVACSQRHSSTERLAKWLLMADDRSHEPTLTISHETLSILLGIRRAGVTVAMGELRRLGCVENGHSKIKITNRERLETCACECYRTLKQEAHRRDKLTASPLG